MSGDAAGRLHEAVARQDWAAAASVLSELCALVKKQADRERRFALRVQRRKEKHRGR